MKKYVWICVLSYLCAGNFLFGGDGNSFSCRTNGTFKVLMISDTHFTAEADNTAHALIGKLIEMEKPDLLIVGGDCISGIKDNQTAQQVRASIANVACVPESKKIPWAIVFGNHDQEHAVKTGLTKKDVLAMYAAYPSNRNGIWKEGISGAGNTHFLIWNSTRTQPVSCLWLIDSGDAPPADLRLPKGMKTDDWIRTDQVFWYWQTSRDLEREYRQKVPGIMFFHIPLPEFREMSLTVKTRGVRNEQECNSKINSGLLAAVVDRGDVKGIFCGHDHENNYIGEWMGVRLGYDGIAGYHGYPHIPVDDPRNDRCRGGRVILIRESDPWHFQTWLRFRNGEMERQGPAE